MSEDLVPVNISCSQDHNGMRFHITAYNSQVEKILDVTLSQPGTRIGQASECFVYWKDDKKNDTWGLNFTSPIDAKQFRECCVSFYFNTVHYYGRESTCRLHLRIHKYTLWMDVVTHR